MALLNDVRFKAGKAPLGFLNPLLYANPQAFQDITAVTSKHKQRRRQNTAALLASR